MEASSMKIDDVDTDYETIKIDKVRIIDPLTGAILFKDETVEFLMSGFSSEVAVLFPVFWKENAKILPQYIA